MMGAVVMRDRFQPLVQTFSKSGVSPDWVVVILPTAVALRTFSAVGSVVIIGLLAATAFIRKPEDRFRIESGPLLLLLASSAIVFSRPANDGPLLTFILIGALIVRLIMTVDARRIIASLIDGCGLYLVANVVCYAAGIVSPSAGVRIGGLVESTGFVRTVFPLTWSINIPPTIAAVYATAFVLLIRESGRLRRSLRIICFVAAIYVLVSTGTRAPMGIAAILTVAVICLPFITRWMAQGAIILTAISAYVLPDIIKSVQFVVAPVISSLLPGRVSGQTSISSLENRDYIWDHAIRYWGDWVNDTDHLLLGYGVNGQYRSGASFTYSELLSTLLRNPERAYVHNSFLQQLFDGGAVGWLLLALSAYWASARLAKRRHSWGHWGVVAIVSMTSLVLSGMTEVSLAPGAGYDTFYLFVVLVGVACQVSSNQSGPDTLDKDNEETEIAQSSRA